MRECIVYEHENLINGKRYFGITTRKPKTRWGNGGTGYKSNNHFWSAIQKYGWDEGFSHKILFEGLSESEARSIEEMLIANYETHDQEHGYNLTLGGELERPNEQTRRKISEAMKGENNPTKRPEVRRKMSESRRGHGVSEETRQKMSEAMKGENNPAKRPEVRRKMSEAQKGKTLSNETCRKLSEAHSKPVEAISPETGLRVCCFVSAKSADWFGFNPRCISNCCVGKQKTHKGYVWRFVEEGKDVELLEEDEYLRESLKQYQAGKVTAHELIEVEEEEEQNEN